MTKKLGVFCLCAFLSFTSCKKVFDKDYYKDCVGEDKVSGDAILILPYYKFSNWTMGYKDWGYHLTNLATCKHKEICMDVGVVREDSMGLYKKELLNTLKQEYYSLKSNIESVDSSKQSIISLRYFYYPKPDYPFYFVSNSYNVVMDTLLNQLTIFYEKRQPTKGGEKESLQIEFSACYLIINKVINEKTKLKFLYYEKTCK